MGEGKGTGGEFMQVWLTGLYKEYTVPTYLFKAEAKVQVLKINILSVYC